MPLLDKSTYDAIIDMLYPLTQNEEQRHNLFTQAFMGMADAPRIDVRAGTQDVALQRIVQGLVKHGFVGDKSALWILLQELFNHVGVDRQEKIAALEPKINVRDLKLAKDIPIAPDPTRRLLITSLIILAILIVSMMVSVVAVPDTQWEHWGYRVGLVAASETATITPSPTMTFTPTPTATPTNTPMPTVTPLEGTPFAEGEVGVVLADFADLDAGAREVERRIERQFEEAGISFIRVHHTIADREHAQQIANTYNATITMWGESADAWIEVFYEITPRSERHVDVTIENIAVSSDLENFSAYILDGMDSLYLVYFTMGQISYFEDDYDTALTLFNQADKRIPQGREAYVKAEWLYFYQGYIYNEFLADPQQALNFYTQALNLNPDIAIAYINRGVAYVNSGEYEQAIADYNRAIELDANFALAYNNRGNAYRNLGEYEQAIADYNRAIELDANFTLAYNNRGNAYVNSGEYDLAIADYTRALGLGANHGDIYNNRGIAYFNSGEYDLAIADFAHAIELDRNYANAFAGRGFAYYSSGIEYYEEAVADIQRYGELTGALEPFMEELIAEMQAALENR